MDGDDMDGTNEVSGSGGTDDEASDQKRSRARWAMWIGIGVAVAAALGFAAILVYANFINDPADELTADDLRERLESSTTISAAPPDTAEDEATDDEADPDESASEPEATTDVDAPPPPLTVPSATDALADDGASDAEGEWRATEQSELGYRVTEVLFGVDTEGVGRTNDITGSLLIEGTTVTSAEFEVDMSTVESDDSRRDGQFRGRIMNVAEFPTASFVLTEPIELGEIPPPGEQLTASATGDLTLRGATNSVTFDVTAQLQDGRIGVLGSIPVVFADYGIVNPSVAGITTEDDGLLEFVLVFER